MIGQDPGQALVGALDVLQRWVKEDFTEHNGARAELVATLGAASAAAWRWRAESSAETEEVSHGSD